MDGGRGELGYVGPISHSPINPQRDLSLGGKRVMRIHPTYHSLGASYVPGVFTCMISILASNPIRHISKRQRTQTRNSGDAGSQDPTQAHSTSTLPPRSQQQEMEAQTNEYTKSGICTQWNITQPQQKKDILSQAIGMQQTWMNLEALR